MTRKQWAKEQFRRKHINELFKLYKDPTDGLLGSPCAIPWDRVREYILKAFDAGYEACFEDSVVVLFNLNKKD